MTESGWIGLAIIAVYLAIKLMQWMGRNL